MCYTINSSPLHVTKLAFMLTIISSNYQECPVPLNVQWCLFAEAKIIYEDTTKCNNRQTCRQGQLAFHLASGMENTGKPYICLNGKV